MDYYKIKLEQANVTSDELEVVTKVYANRKSLPPDAREIVAKSFLDGALTVKKMCKGPLMGALLKQTGRYARKTNVETLFRDLTYEAFKDGGMYLINRCNIR